MIDPTDAQTPPRSQRPTQSPRRRPRARALHARLRPRAPLAALAVVVAAALPLAACGGGSGTSAGSATVNRSVIGPGEKSTAAPAAGATHGAAMPPSATGHRAGAQASAPRSSASGRPLRRYHLAGGLDERLKHFAACMRGKGVRMPEPNVTHVGAIFNPKQVNTHAPGFQSALRVCRAQLLKTRKP